jgi:tetratricopeptide (TPR) repeat protein
MIGTARLHMELGDRDEAMRWLVQASRTDHPPTLYDVGRLFSQLRAGDRAEACYRRAANGGSCDAMCSLGMYLWGEGQIAEAETWYREASKRAVGDPELQGPLLVLGGLLTRPRGEADNRERREPETAPAASEDRNHDPVIVVDAGDPAGTVIRMRHAYLSSGDPKFLQLGIDHGRRAAGVLAPGDERRAGVLAGLCSLLRLAYERDKDEERLAESIELGRLVVTQTPPGHTDYPAVLSSLGNALQEEFMRAKDPAVLAEAAGLYRTAKQQIPSDHPELPVLLSELGNTLLAHADHRHDDGLLDQAIVAYRDALSADVPGTPRYPISQYNLGQALMVSFTHTWNLPVLNEARDLFAAALAALAALPASHVARDMIEQKLASSARLHAAKPPADGNAGPGAGADTGYSGEEPARLVAYAESLLAQYEKDGDLPKPSGCSGRCLRWRASTQWPAFLRRTCSVRRCGRVLNGQGIWRRLTRAPRCWNRRS